MDDPSLARPHFLFSHVFFVHSCDMDHLVQSFELDSATTAPVVYVIRTLPIPAMFFINFSMGQFHVNPGHDLEIFELKIRGYSIRTQTEDR